MNITKRVCTHPKRTDRQLRAQELQKRMANDGRSVEQREHERGYHKNCNHAAQELLTELFSNHHVQNDFKPGQEG